MASNNHNEYQGYSNPNSNANQYQGYQDPVPSQNPWSQEHSQNNQTSPSNPYAQTQSQPQNQNQNPYQQPSYSQQPQNPSYTDSSTPPPGLPPRRSATDIALPTGQDRTHQIEVMQSYEAAGRKNEDDSNVEILAREFPKLDGSLIAAIYGDSKSLSATREMLQALGEE